MVSFISLLKRKTHLKVSIKLNQWFFLVFAPVVQSKWLSQGLLNHEYGAFQSSLCHQKTRHLQVAFLFLSFVFPFSCPEFFCLSPFTLSFCVPVPSWVLLTSHSFKGFFWASQHHGWVDFYCCHSCDRNSFLWLIPGIVLRWQLTSNHCRELMKSVDAMVTGGWACM